MVPAFFRLTVSPTTSTTDSLFFTSAATPTAKQRLLDPNMAVGLSSLDKPVDPEYHAFRARFVNPFVNTPRGYREARSSAGHRRPTARRVVACRACRSKRLSAPDEVRSYPGGSAVLVNVGETAVGRAVYEPGWRWTTHIRQIAGTAHCQLHHLGYSISGLMHVVSDDGAGDRHRARVDLRDPARPRRVGRGRRAVDHARMDQRAHVRPARGGSGRIDAAERALHRHRRLDRDPAPRRRRRAGATC